jgi:hypothetical protein
MTVTQLRAALEELERSGHSGLPVFYTDEYLGAQPVTGVAVEQHRRITAEIGEQGPWPRVILDSAVP